MGRRKNKGKNQSACDNHEASLFAQAKGHHSLPTHVKHCCDTSNNVTFTSLRGNKGKWCTRSYSCAQLGLPSGSPEQRIGSGKCDHLKVGFCNNLNNLKNHWNGICKFCMNPNSGCSDRTVKDFCRRNGNPVCRCINTKATTDLERKLVEYNGENLACWSNECRRGTQPRSDRFVPSGWWKSISACRTPSLCIMNFNDVDVQQYGGVVKFHQNCGGGATTTGDVKSTETKPESESVDSKIKDELDELKKKIVEMSVERDATDASSVEIPIGIVLGVFGVLFLVLMISRKRRQ